MKAKKPQLTEFDRQVLLKIGKDCKPSSPIKSRHWTDPPPSDEVRQALHRLFLHEMLKAAGAYWRVKPTEKGWAQIENDKAWLKRRRERSRVTPRVSAIF